MLAVTFGAPGAPSLFCSITCHTLLMRWPSRCIHFDTRSLTVLMPSHSLMPAQTGLYMLLSLQHVSQSLVAHLTHQNMTEADLLVPIGGAFVRACEAVPAYIGPAHPFMLKVFPLTLTWSTRLSFLLGWPSTSTAAAFRLGVTDRFFSVG